MPRLLTARFVSRGNMKMLNPAFTTMCIAIMIPIVACRPFWDVKTLYPDDDPPRVRGNLSERLREQLAKETREEGREEDQ